MKMKPGFIGDEVEEGVDGWLEWTDAQDPRPSGVEIRTADGVRVHDLTTPQCRAIKRQLTQAGLAVHALASGFGKFNYRPGCDPSAVPDRTAINAQLKMLRMLVARAEIFETRVIRGFGLWRMRDLTVMWLDIVAFFEKALPLIPEGMVLAIENEAATGLASLSDIACLRRALGDDKRIGAIWDPGNYVYDTSLLGSLNIIGDDLGIVLGEELRKHRKIIRVVHAKNCVVVRGSLRAETVALSAGAIDYESLLNDLDFRRYDGPVDLEPHRTVSGGQLSEASRAMPGGEGYGNPKACTEDWLTLRALIE